jgi:hypothetical protein
MTTVDWRRTIGIVLFFLVPLALWGIGAAAAYRRGQRSGLAFIAGNDHRLSLSRLQAFSWTLTIFGAFASAMAVSSKVTTERWIGIPNALLILAGISIGSGVFSSLIATVSGEERSATISGFISYQDAAAAKDGGINLQPTFVLPTGLILWIVTGQDLGDKAGSIRIGRNSMHIVSWANNQIIFTAQERFKGKTLIVDTANGKVCYGLDDSMRLQQPVVCYELVDLFRDDKDPGTLSLMKFQMFGWTLVALVIYWIMFVIHLDGAIENLPNVDQSIVILTGISQGGYLAGKGVSSVSNTAT